ncbi:hypothetical protein [Amycolatopsis sulphurea]|uniref:hypothetical protein n=1 Tax=Amycolatopsis sulphurea TaxID=76022 RepID=UPI001145BEAE|nr:hypothetical protein [Amycolatopsis sulphurea]
MPEENVETFEEWRRLKPSTAFAVDALRSSLAGQDTSPASIIDAYLFAKRTLARSMQELLRAQLPDSSRAAFRRLRKNVETELKSRFSDRVPDQYLNPLYGTKANEELFAVLHAEIGCHIDIARLRTVNGDDVHTERRIRELRELGLKITATSVNGNQHYMLHSLDLDSSKFGNLVEKSINRSTSLSKEKKEELIKRIL